MPERTGLVTATVPDELLPRGPETARQIAAPQLCVWMTKRGGWAKASA